MILIKSTMVFMRLGIIGYKKSTCIWFKMTKLKRTILIRYLTLLNIITSITCFDLDGVQFEVIKYKKSLSTVTYRYSSASAIECAALCGTKSLCFSMNFNQSGCELLSETFGTLPNFEDDQNSQYIRKSYFCSFRFWYYLYSTFISI